MYVCTLGMVYAGPESVLLVWNCDRNLSTICGRGTPVGSFIDGCGGDSYVTVHKMKWVCTGNRRTLIFQRSRGSVALSRFCSNTMR